MKRTLVIFFIVLNIISIVDKKDKQKKVISKIEIQLEKEDEI